MQDNTEGRGMYSEWASLSPLIQHGSQESHSVLDKFGAGTGKEVALGVVKQLASNLGITQAAESSPLSTDREVQWCMEVICFGLTLPLSEHDTIKDCVNVYCEWLSALLPVTKICVPKPVCEDPNLYARKIISHFHNLFVPRKGEGVDIINRQAVLCHRVLRTLQQLAHDSSQMSPATWRALLLFLLAINDTLLAPPTVRDDVADQLCERVLSVLFETWLLACARCFPAPPLWRTLREACLGWRHRSALVEQWNRVALTLTGRVLELLYGAALPELREDELVPPAMTPDCVVQAWFRFLHCLGNPVALCRPELVSRTDKFLQFAIASDADPCQHACLQALPLIFLKAIKGVAGQVDAFLGLAQSCPWEEAAPGDRGKEAPAGAHSASHSPTPPPQRRLAKSFSVAPSATSKGIPKTSLMGLTSSRVSSIPPSSISSSGPSSNSSLTSMTSLNFESRSPLAQGRPKCNSILHLFGEWLFEAAFIGSDITFRKRQDSDASARGSQPQPGSLPSALTIDKYESGRAEALGALCRVFCAKKTGEEILPAYLARFCLALRAALRHAGEPLASVLLNAPDLFRLDLAGVQLLAPDVCAALEAVLPAQGRAAELRRACVQLLLSLLPLPLHYRGVPAQAQLKPRLANLLMGALQVETDALSTHMLLGGLLLAVQDAAELELVERQAQLDDPNCSLLCSVSDALSMASGATCTAEARSEAHSLPDDCAHSISDSISSSPVDSAHALFVRATYLVCHRLISTWKSDLNVSLAALELLSGLARIQIRESDALECKRAVKWTCDYIVSQCSRPPPAHSKDLHSTIVAAFQCLGVWLLSHPSLLRDRECLATVLETCELGVSGAKSVGKPGEPVRLKDDKELKPASMRVRDAAEALLASVLEQAGCFPSACGPESLCSLLDEASLLRHCETRGSGEGSGARFRYFVTEGSVLLALLEEPLGNDQDPQPTVTLLVRGPFGRHAWTLQLRHLPRHRSGTKYHAPNVGRPVPMQEPPPRAERQQRCFPDTVDRVPHCKVDESIPTLEMVTMLETDKLAQLVQRQAVWEARGAEPGPAAAAAECAPPPLSHDYQTARLFLSHFGLLRGHGQALTALDSSAPGFRTELAALDRISPRTCDTVHVFYVRAGQSSAKDILDNVRHESTVSPAFLAFLPTLGWPVAVRAHAGWAGGVRGGPGDGSSEPPPADPEHGGAMFDGRTHVLYWADATAEVAFVVPSQHPHDSGCDVSFNSAYSHASWYGQGNETNESSKEKPRALSLDLDKSAGGAARRSGCAGGGGRAPPPPQPAAARVLVVWLESFEDHLRLPAGELLSCAGPAPTLVVFLHWLRSGLLRVRLSGPSGRTQLATPLVDGMVVSRRALGPLVRQTAVNMSRRRRLDNDTYQPPHVRRRLKIQEIVQKYKREMTEPELLTYLFSDP